MRSLILICMFTLGVSQISGSSWFSGLRIPKLSFPRWYAKNTTSEPIKSNIPNYFQIAMNVNDTINFYVTHQTNDDYKALLNGLDNELLSQTEYTKFCIVNDKLLIEISFSDLQNVKKEDVQQQPLLTIALFINRDTDLTDEILETLTEDIIEFAYLFFGLNLSLENFILTFLNILDLVLELFDKNQIYAIGTKINSILTSNTLQSSTKLQSPTKLQPKTEGSVTDNIKTAIKSKPWTTFKLLKKQWNKRNEYISLLQGRLVDGYEKSKFAVLLTAILGYTGDNLSENLPDAISKIETQVFCTAILKKITSLFAQS